MTKHRPKMNPFARLCALALCIALWCAPQKAQAALDVQDWRLEARPGFTWLTDPSDDLMGFSVGLMGSYRVFDTLHVKLDADLIFFEIDQPNQQMWTELTAGINYDIDLTPLLPTIGTGIGPLFKKPKGQDVQTEAVWHALLALSYFVSDEVALGVEFRPHFILSDLNQDPFFFTVAAKAMVAF